MLVHLVKSFDRIGPFWVAIIFAILVGNGVYLTRNLVATWVPDDPSIVTAGDVIRGNDFFAFWTAAHLAANGEAETVYGMIAIRAAQKQFAGVETTEDRRFLYPPTFLLMLLPLGHLPYLPALSLWQVLPFVGFLLVMARMGLPPFFYWMLPFSAAVVQTIVTGQNGLLTALFLAGGFFSLERNPRIAGILLALFTYKPQFALLIVAALIIWGYWRALGAMMATIAVVTIVSVAVFGSEAWLAFFETVIYAQEQLTLGNAPWWRMPTIFVAARMSGLSETSAHLLQGISALGVFAGVAWAWWHRLPFNLKVSLLIAAIPLATPWAHEYDQVILLMPIAWLILVGQGKPLSHLEIAIIVLVWMLPSPWTLALVQETGISFGPLILLAFYGLILNRALRAPRAV